MGFILIYWTPMSSSYVESNLEKRRIQPDWRNTSQMYTAGLGSIGFKLES